MSSSMLSISDVSANFTKVLDTLHSYMIVFVLALLVVNLWMAGKLNSICAHLKKHQGYEGFGSPRHHAAYVAGTRQRWFGNEITTPGMETDALTSSGDCPSLRSDGSYGFQTRYQSHSPVLEPAETSVAPDTRKEGMQSEAERKINSALNSTLNVSPA